MVTMMQHPKHGRHPALGHEIENMKANGWTVAPPAPATQAAEVSVQPRRRGPNKKKA